MAGLLEEHPLHRWYTSQPDWSPVRISDVIPWERFRRTQPLTKVLAPIGACHMIAIMLVPPSSGQFVYFGTTHADPDFTDDELGWQLTVVSGLRCPARWRGRGAVMTEARLEEAAKGPSLGRSY